MKIAIIVIVILNVFLTVLYGVDKVRAKRNKWRIKEATLIFPAFLFGSIGAMLGMIIFNHKTSKTKFRFFIPFAFVLNLVFIYLLISFECGF